MTSGRDARRSRSGGVRDGSSRSHFQPMDPRANSGPHRNSHHPCRARRGISSPHALLIARWRWRCQRSPRPPPAFPPSPPRWLSVPPPPPSPATLPARHPCRRPASPRRTLSHNRHGSARTLSQLFNGLARAISRFPGRYSDALSQLTDPRGSEEAGPLAEPITMDGRPTAPVELWPGQVPDRQDDRSIG